jgi:hypothetical protein
LYFWNDRSHSGKLLRRPCLASVLGSSEGSLNWHICMSESAVLVDAALYWSTCTQKLERPSQIVRNCARRYYQRILLLLPLVLLFLFLFLSLSLSLFVSFSLFFLIRLWYLLCFIFEDNDEEEEYEKE